MNKLNTLISNCKCGVYLSVNEHRDYYETVEEHFKSHPYIEDLEDIDKDVYDRMKESNTIIELQYYSDTPVGSYKVYHYDLDLAVDEALASLNLVHDGTN